MDMDWRGFVPAGIAYIPSALNPQSKWEFGLYRGLKREAKPSQCAFKFYPAPCPVVPPKS